MLCLVGQISETCSEMGVLKCGNRSRSMTVNQVPLYRRGISASRAVIWNLLVVMKVFRLRRSRMGRSPPSFFGMVK